MKNDKQLLVRVTKELKDEFDNYCKQRGYSVSKRLRILIEEDVKNDTR